MTPPPFIPQTTEDRTYALRGAPGGTLTLTRGPYSLPGVVDGREVETGISVPRHGPGGEADSPDLVAWVRATFAEDLREVWDGEWSIADPRQAAIFEAHLATLADLRGRFVKTSDPRAVPAIIAARPPAIRTERLEWTLRWFPGMENQPPRYASVVASTSWASTSVAYGVSYGPETSDARASDWFRAKIGIGLGPAPPMADATGRVIEATLLDEDGLARLIESIMELPAQAVDYFSARWETRAA